METSRTPAPLRFQFEPRRAFQAARVLADNPDDLPKVFTIIDSLSADTLSRAARRMQKSPSGRALLAAKPDITPLLADREALRRLPEGSLGRAYLAFMESEVISAEGIRGADAEGSVSTAPLAAPLDWVHARMRDTHDLWHAATGYRGDVLGELALLGFTFAQTWNPGIALILAIGVSKMIGAPEARLTILDGFRRGKAAAWLPEQPWEALLALPLEEVRHRLGLGPTPVYTPVRSDELRAAGIVGKRGAA